MSGVEPLFVSGVESATTANVGRDENAQGQPTALPICELPTRTRTWYAVPAMRFTLAPARVAVDEHAGDVFAKKIADELVNAPPVTKTMLNCVAFEKVTHSLPDESNDAELMTGVTGSGI